MAASLAHPARIVALAALLATTSCSTVSKLWGGGDKASEGTAGFITGFYGAVAGDEPLAVQAARDILSAGGNAADATVAGVFAMAATLPSRAGLGGGGACLAHKGDQRASGVPDAIMFLPQAGSGGGDRPAAVPMMARGLFLLHARHGRANFDTLVAVGERLARDGAPVSRALARDLAVVAGPLAGDPGARAVFFPGGRVAAEGTTLIQPELGATLANLRRGGVGDLYAGGLALRLVTGAAAAGGGIVATDLRTALPKLTTALILPAPDESEASFLPTPADGGLAAAAVYKALMSGADVNTARARGLAAAAAWRQTGAEPETILAGSPAAGALPSMPATASFAALDREGNAVVCALTMGNLFGTGRMAEGTGIVLAASPKSMPPALLSAGMITVRRNSQFRALAGGSGQEGAGTAVGLALARAAADKGAVFRPDPAAAPEPGRSNQIGCARGVRVSESCSWASDPRGFGLATGSN